MVNNNVFDSFLLKNYINKIILTNLKCRFYRLIFESWYNLKYKRLKINILFLFIIQKLRPIFNVYTVKPKSRKKKNLRKKRYYPRALTKSQQYKLAISWFLLPFFINQNRIYRFNFLVENCFFFFLSNRKKNHSMTRKKQTYLLCYRLKNFVRLKN